jgi:flagellar protein FliO/FliZ
MISNICLFQSSSTINNIAELFGLLIVFVLILILAYYTSKWIGKAGTGMTAKNHNITIVETLRLSQTKCLQIIKVADKYIVIAVSKDHIEYLTEIDGEKLDISASGTQAPSFKEILTKIKSGNNMKSIEQKEDEKDKNDV